jgi:phosphoserine phosphatase
VRTAAFFRLEGALSDLPAWAGAMWLASNAPGMRRRLFGVGGVALSASLARRDPAITRNVAWSMLRGFTEDRIAVLGEDWARERVLPSIKDEARRLIDEARAAGRTLVLISESIEEVARPVGDALGFEHVLSNAIEREDGEATGVLHEPVIGSEVDPRRLRELAAAEAIDLARSCAYGASRGDGVLLSLVGLPCAIDPDRELARMARDLDWPVVRSVDVSVGGAR